MTSEKQVAANRRNAAKSTGPKTVKGKQMTRMNALKHGLRSECVVIPGERPEEFEALLRSLEENYKPVGAVEGVLIERIAHCLWRLRRISVIQTAIMRREHFLIEKERAREERDRARIEVNRIADAYDDDSDKRDLEEEDSDDADYDDLPEDYAEALRRYEMAEEAYDTAEDELRGSLSCLAEVFSRARSDLDILSPYERRTERQLRTAMEDLERFQAARRTVAAEAIIDITNLEQGES